MSDSEVEAKFKELRWPLTNGEPICPHCGGLDAYPYRHKKGTQRYTCRACTKEFSITSGTLFASHKKSLRVYLLAIVLFVNDVKGKAALALSRDLGLAYKSAFVLLHKLRDAMEADLRGRKVGGEGKIVELDAAWFGGYQKPKNTSSTRKDRRRKEYQTGKRRAVVAVRQRGGDTICGVFKSEGEALRFVSDRVLPGTIIHADASLNWNDLQFKYRMKRINHEEAFSKDGACSNQAESFFSRLRRGEIGHHHHISGLYLHKYAKESAWRENHRRVDNGGQAFGIVGLAMNTPPSVDFSGYWQRRKPKEQAAA